MCWGLLEKYFDGILSMQRSEINRAIIPTIDEKLLIEKNVGKNSVTQTVIGKWGNLSKWIRLLLLVVNNCYKFYSNFHFLTEGGFKNFQIF